MMSMLAERWKTFSWVCTAKFLIPRHSWLRPKETFEDFVQLNMLPKFIDKTPCDDVLEIVSFTTNQYVTVKNIATYLSYHQDANEKLRKAQDSHNYFPSPRLVEKLRLHIDEWRNETFLPDKLKMALVLRTQENEWSRFENIQIGYTPTSIGYSLRIA